MYTNNILTKIGNRFNKKSRGKVLLCLLCLAIVLTFNIVRSFAGAEKKNSLQQNELINTVGVVKGILHNDSNPTVLIGTELIHEGDVISGAKVIKIHKDRVEFVKDKNSWTQYVMEGQGQEHCNN